MTNEEGRTNATLHGGGNGGPHNRRPSCSTGVSSGSTPPEPEAATIAASASGSGSGSDSAAVVPDGRPPSPSSLCGADAAPAAAKEGTTMTTTTTPKETMPPQPQQEPLGSSAAAAALMGPAHARLPTPRAPQTRPYHAPTPTMQLRHQWAPSLGTTTTTATATSQSQSQSTLPVVGVPPLVNFNPTGGADGVGGNPLVAPPQFGSTSFSVPMHRQQPGPGPGPGPGPLVLQFQQMQQHYGRDVLHHSHQVQMHDARHHHHHQLHHRNLPPSSSVELSSSLAQYEDKFREMTDPRRGKWTPDEENYSYELIRQFANGTAPDCGNGVTLRSYLAKKLNCAPMRVSKKFAGQNIGKSAFVYRGTSPTRSAAAASLVPPLSSSLSPDDGSGEDDEERNSEQGRKLRYLELRFYASIFQPSPFGDGGGGGGAMTGLKNLFPEHGTSSNAFPPVLGGASNIGQSTSTSIPHPNESSNALFAGSSGNVGQYYFAQHGPIHNPIGGAVLFRNSSVALPRQGAFVSDQHTYIIGNSGASPSDCEHGVDRTGAAGSKHALDGGDTSKSNFRVWLSEPSEPSSLPWYMNLCQDQMSSTTESSTGGAQHKSFAIVSAGTNNNDGTAGALRRHASDPQLPNGAPCHGHSEAHDGRGCDAENAAAAACRQNAVFGPMLPPSLPSVVGTMKENERGSTNATGMVSVDDYGLFAEQSVDAVSQHSAYCDGKGGDVQSLRGPVPPHG